MRGFLGGGFWGLVLGGVTVAGVSLVNPPPGNTNSAPVLDTADVSTDTPAIVAGDNPEILAPEETSSAPELPAAEDPVDMEEAPRTFVEPVGDVAPAVDVTEAAPVAAPVAEVPVAEDTAAVTPDAPEADVVTADDSATVTPEIAEPVGSGAQVADSVADLAVPSQTDAPSAIPTTDTAPDAGDTPAVVTATTGDATPAAPETAPSVQPAVAAAATLDTPPDAPQSAEVSANAEAPVLPSPQSQALDAPEESAASPTQDDIVENPTAVPTLVVDAPTAEEAPSVSAGVPAIETVADAAPLTPQAPLSPATPAIRDAAPTSDESGVVTAEVEVVAIVDEPARALPGGNTGVRVNRLTAGNRTTEVAEDAPEASVETAVFPEGTPAITRFAATYSNPDDLPEMSIVLTDDGSLDGAVAAVAGIPFPVSVMLNPSMDGAQERMDAYRAVGVEVGMLAALPPAATASDIAIYFEAAFAAMPEAVVVLDAQGETQGDMDVIQQTVAALAEDGQGLITVPRGLNSAPRVAAENGVPAGVIYRDVDGEGQDAPAIRRFMDQAAFRARQDSGVIMLGQVQSETISALIQWSAASRAEQVAVVPVSATLTAD